MDLYTSCGMGLYTSCGHWPVHCLWLHAALWPWTCTPLVATCLYTAWGCMQPCGHGPVHCLWLHAALWPRTCTLLVAACSLVSTDLYTACGCTQPTCRRPGLVAMDLYTACSHSRSPFPRPSSLGPRQFSVLTATQLGMRMAPARECYFPKPEQGPYSASKSSRSASPLLRPC